MHHPPRHAYGSLFNAFLLAASIAASITTLSVAWDSLPYSHGDTLIAGFYVPPFYVAVSLCAVAPLATALLLGIVRSLPRRPGWDKAMESEKDV